MKDEITLALIEEIVTTVEHAVSRINEQIRTLSDEANASILTGDFDPDQGGWRKGQLANFGGGGLKQWDGQRWSVVLNGIESVDIKDGKLIVERTDGTVEESLIAKPRKKALAA